MRRLVYLASLSLVVMLVLAPVAGAQETVTVSMEDNFFDQANITVPAGTTVTWVQNGDNPHTTTSYDGLWDSGMIAGGSGESFSYTFEEPGTYEYYCIPHEALGMVGTVTVTDDAATDDGAAADQYAEETVVEEDDGEPLPATGGPGLLLPAALAALISGLIGLSVVRRRDS